MDSRFQSTPYAGDALSADRLAFIRRVYTWLMAGFLVAGAGALTAPYVLQALFGLLGRFTIFGLVIGQYATVIWASRVSARSPQNRVAFGVFTYVSGVIAGILSYAVAQTSGPSTVLAAFGMTAADFLLLTAVAFISRRDFSFLWSFVAVGFGIAIVGMIANLFFRVEAMSLLISAVVAIAASAKVLLDTSMMVRGGYQGDAAGVALSLFVSFYNIFISLLNLLGRRR